MKMRSLCIICIVLGLAIAGCGGKEKDRGQGGQVISGVTVAVVRPVQVDSFYETSGTVRAKTVSVVASRVMGTVTAVMVKEGDKVRAGDVLLSIDNADASQRVRAAEAGLAEAEKGKDSAAAQRTFAETTYKRHKNLYDEKVISGQELDQIETQKKVADAAYDGALQAVKRAKAGLEEARAYNEYTRPKAPVSGIVSEKKIDAGSMAMPGMPLITVEDTSAFKVETYVDESLAGKVSRETNVFILLEGAKDKITAKVSKVAPSVDPKGRTFLVEIGLQGQSFRTGQYAKVLIPTGKKDALLVPAAALVERGQLTGVFVVDEKGTIAYRLVKAGRTFDGGVEVLSGLQANERIIVAGVEKALDGATVKQ